jgi:hypothetical protein
MIKTIRISAKENEISGVHSVVFDHIEGHKSIKRVSSIEYDNDHQQWRLEFSDNVEESPLLFDSRKEAINYEVKVLNGVIR